MCRKVPPSLFPCEGLALGYNPIDGGNLPAWVSAQLTVARLICLRLLLQLIRAAASRTFWTAGRSRPIRMAMMAITTSSSISVKPRQRWNTLMIGMTAPLERSEQIKTSVNFRKEDSGQACDRKEQPWTDRHWPKGRHEQ